MNYNLNKKLIEELGEGRIAIDNTGNLKLDLLKAIMLEAFPKYGSFDGLGGSNKYYFKDRFGNYFLWESQSTTNLPTVSLLDFIEKEWKYTVDYVKQNKVAIRVNTIEEGKKVVNLIGFPYHGNYPIKDYEEFCIDIKSTNASFTHCHKYYYIEQHYEIINASDFIKNNTKMENKEEIVGWKIDKKDYLHAANCISTLENIKEDTILTESEWSRSLKKLREAGVLDLWFKEVYTTKEKVLTLSNGKQVKIRKGEILAILDSIGSKIELNSLTALLRPFFSQLKNWPVELTDAKYKIGCWENVTLADIKLIIKEYEELNK